MTGKGQASKTLRCRNPKGPAEQLTKTDPKTEPEPFVLGRARELQADGYEWGHAVGIAALEDQNVRSQACWMQQGE